MKQTRGFQRAKISLKITTEMGYFRSILILTVLVPFMCVLYVVIALAVLVMNLGVIPDVFGLIFRSAFSPSEAGGAFIGGSVGMAFLWGMKRALFSSEAGQGSSPIAHSAAQTKEPISESVVAGLEPFIDTIVVCTLTALVILSTGALERGDGVFYPLCRWIQGAEVGFYFFLGFGWWCCGAVVGLCCCCCCEEEEQCHFVCAYSMLRWFLA